MQVVECENAGFDHEKNKFDWKCHADISDRVRFNHVEVICEGYDYPEDDHILLGSCGLEFTLDYTDPHDYHHNSYFKHLDEHEKDMHHERVRAKAKKDLQSRQSNHGHKTFSQFYTQISSSLCGNAYQVGALMIVLLLLFMAVNYSVTRVQVNKRASGRKQFSQNGQLAAAVLTTKKAC